MRVEIFLEGASKGYREAEWRKAFAAFFTRAGLEGRLPTVVPCGSREDAFSDFCVAHAQQRDDYLPILLVDSETPVTESDPWSHLARSADKWKRPRGTSAGQAQLMVQSMEAWFLADSSTLATYYGKEFLAKHVPLDDIEGRNVDELKKRLASATSRCKSKGKYSDATKAIHAFEIIERLDPARVERLPHARRLLTYLRHVCTRRV